MTTCIPHFHSPSSCMFWGLSSVSLTQYQRPCSPMALTEPGLTRRDRLSHVAGDAPLACCLSLPLIAVSWMQPDNELRRRCECPFLSMTPDARVQEHYRCYSCSSQFILPVSVTCCAKGQWPYQWVFHPCCLCQFLFYQNDQKLCQHNISTFSLKEMVLIC